jgi:cyclophilin family peptidyl-prolyl cis-trans isomerase
LTKGVFKGTPISRYEPNFVLQVDLAQSKADGQRELSKQQLALVRRLPLEVDSQRDGSLLHKKWVLSMARDDNDRNSATTSFSLILGNAHHLDHNYTIFGHVVADEVTVHTIDTIIDHWKKEKPVIVSVKQM